MSLWTSLDVDTLKSPLSHVTYFAEFLETPGKYILTYFWGTVCPDISALCFHNIEERLRRLV
jgi:hypothetical protein